MATNSLYYGDNLDILQRYVQNEGFEPQRCEKLL